MSDSPWSKVPILSAEDQIEYDKMRNLAELQERIDELGEGYPAIKKKKKSSRGIDVQYVDSSEDMIELLTALLEGDLK